MDIDTIIAGIVIPLVGGLFLLAGRSKWFRGDSPMWVGNVLVFAGIFSIARGVLACMQYNKAEVIASHIDPCRTFLAGGIVGCLAAIAIAGELTPARWKKRKAPNHASDATS